jgi:16S rRNA processing protein RimM
MAERFVPLAEITRPHGVWGEVRLKVYNSDSELLLSQPDVLVRRANRPDTVMQLESIRGADAGFLLAKFRGIDGRDAAELLRGASVCVDRALFPLLEEGEFYVCDVIGARLVGPSGEVGTVEDFISYPSADVLVVRLEGGAVEGKIELPLVDDFVLRVDAGAGQVLLTSEGVAWAESALAGSRQNHAG